MLASVLQLALCGDNNPSESRDLLTCVSGARVERIACPPRVDAAVGCWRVIITLSSLSKGCSRSLVSLVQLKLFYGSSRALQSCYFGSMQLY